MTTTGFNLPALATATVDLLGHDWETALITPYRAAGAIQHRDGRHDASSSPWTPTET
ncbi:hypothetical protein [Streptomyces sp. NPDC050485]|uniref:hypothetical protein n=1 Tax=Streptomyces sp. NPDC050485 TaxID=3365617 RepID=UPI0037AB50D7